MNLVTFGFNEKGAPVFLNEEPYTQVGTMYLMKSGKNSVVGITLDDKLFKAAAKPGAKKRGRPGKAAAKAAKPGRPKKAAKPAKAGAKRRGRPPKAKVEKKAEAAV